MNPTSLFSGRATDYAKYRPSYLTEAIATILEGLDHPSKLVAADIGAGTGIASQLLARGIRVIAIEPNGERRELGERTLYLSPVSANVVLLRL